MKQLVGAVRRAEVFGKDGSVFETTASAGQTQLAARVS
jgi:hypothetical protein